MLEKKLYLVHTDFLFFFSNIGQRICYENKVSCNVTEMSICFII